MSKRLTRSVLPAIALATVSSGSYAAGFAIAEQSVKGLGTAFSGGAASADDASTIWYNPAGMTRLKGTHVSSGMHLIFPNGKYHDDGSFLINPTSGAPSAHTGSANGVRDNDAEVPSFYASHQFNDKLWAGIGMTAPFGLVTDYDADWVGRYHALRSDVFTLNFNPSFAYKFSDVVSFGFGVNIQYIDVKLSRQIDFNTICLGLEASATVPGGTCGAFGLSTVGNSASDSTAKLEGEDWSYGYNFGFLIEPSENTRFGFHYRSRIKQDLEGAADFILSPQAQALQTNVFAAGGNTIFTDTSLTGSLSLPDSLSISAFHQINPKWSVQADATWFNWSRFDELRIKFGNPDQPDSVTPEHWDNSIRYAIGTNYKINNKFTVRGGFAIDETPIPNAELRTPRVADEDRVWLAVGGSYKFSDHMSFDIGYTHIFVEDSAVDYRTGDHSPASTTAAGALPESILVGNFDASVDILSMQVNMTFD